ncbi:MAG: polysaccharide biosynthesis protein [Rickettsiaceae bacterium]|nr:polysaccharide biosynthesis protein [Rickettsiaceae bacterium]
MSNYLITGSGVLATAIKNKTGGVLYSRSNADIIGSIENSCKLNSVFEKIKPDVVIHTAAIASITQCQNNKREAIQTNVLGSLNVLNACKKYKAKPIFLSSVAANNPSGIYGASKLLMELMGDAVYCRLGTVLSKKSIIYKWYEQIQNGEILKISDFSCVRYLITLEEATKSIIDCKSKPNGVYTPRMYAFSIKDIISVLEILTEKKAIYTICGLSPGEKLKDCKETSNSLLLLDKIRTICQPL